MKKLDFNLSASTLNGFVSCPYAFKQDKILKRETIRAPSVFLVFGQAFHKLLETFYKKGTFKTYDLFQNWEKFFDIEVKTQEAHGNPQLKFFKATGFTMVKNWVAMAKENNWLHEPYLEPEWEFLLPYDNDKFEINVHGFMDLVIENDSKVYIIDWKTGKHSEDNYKRQAVLYSWAMYKKFGVIEDCVKFVHPAKKQNFIVDVHVKDEDYLEIKRVVDEMFYAIESDYYIKKPEEKKCGWCNWADCEHNTNEKLKQLIEENS